MEDFNLSSENVGDYTAGALSSSTSTCFFSDVILEPPR